ncbi:MAG: Glucose-1-phosphate thymidylyltransferase 2 [candidate division BRC1 bacterium ADurb.BinA364]|nr:MAG: Glucose-1-phosphate thymidylyltransferase 2 [candidate division BRC1 bacterium ADurb.BinA364]
MRLEYAVQPRPEGLAQAFLIGADFIGASPVCLVLGDNLFYGEGLADILRSAAGLERGATIFGYRVRDPERYGVVEFDSRGMAISLEEKPRKPKSRYAVPGIYFYGPDVAQAAATLRPSARNELEITDLNRLYLERGQLAVSKLGRGIAWLDTGTNRSLMEASQFIQAIEQRTGMKVACLEEIAWDNGWIDRERVRSAAEEMGDCAYGEYLRELLADRPT